MKAVLTAITSSWESGTTFWPRRETWLFTLPREFRPVMRISPALYVPDEIFWNWRSEMLTLARSTGMGGSRLSG